MKVLKGKILVLALVFGLVSILLLLIFLFYSSIPSSSQNPEWINFTYGNNVLAIAFEGNYVWVGTTGGLVRLDKTTGAMTFYNRANSGLPDNSVQSIAIDKQGNKWIGTWDGGLAKFDGKNWVVYNRANSGLPSNNVYSIAIDKQGNKWIGTGGKRKFVKFDGTNWMIFYTADSGVPNDDILTISIDRYGNKWLGTSGGGLVVYREGGVKLDMRVRK
ncbi:MAG: hypothetical protein N2252_04250 [Candidatus Kryptonium sp.]|nr:hypothetical protein [Candidatus Kryptonium sp.]